MTSSRQRGDPSVEVERTRGKYRVMTVFLTSATTLAVGLFGGTQLGTRLGSHAPSEPTDSHVDPLQRKFSTPLSIAFEIRYNYPEQFAPPLSFMLARHWDRIFFGRQPPVYSSNSKKALTQIEPARAVQGTLEDKRSRGIVELLVGVNRSNNTIKGLFASLNQDDNLRGWAKPPSRPLVGASTSPERWWSSANSSRTRPRA